jgi:hypothetical protein
VNLATNLQFHYGLVNWFIGQNVMAKPTTRFVVPYLTLVGQLKDEGNKLDTAFAFLEMKKHYASQMAADAPNDPSAVKAMSDVIDRKFTLLTRAIDRLLDDPHLLAGWLSLNRRNYKLENGKIVWIRNPLGVLNDTYEYLNMGWDPKAPSAEVIWQHDHELLQRAIRFYQELRKTFGLRKEEFYKLNEILKSEAPQGGYDAATWDKIRSAHLGFEAGNELLGLLFMLAESVKFFDFRVEPNLAAAAFDVFAENSINFGIMLTYRQTWEPLQYQVGDLVSTIPLAPNTTTFIATRAPRPDRVRRVARRQRRPPPARDPWQRRPP